MIGRHVVRHPVPTLAWWLAPFRWLSRTSAPFAWLNGFIKSAFQFFFAEADVAAEEAWHSTVKRGHLHFPPNTTKPNPQRPPP